MFFQLERPAQLSVTLRRAEAWRMLDLLLAVEREGTSSETAWYETLLTDVGGPAAGALLGLLEERVAIAGPTWSRFAEGVILFQAADRSAVERLLSAGGPANTLESGAVEVHELAGGLRLAYDGRIGVLARPRTDPALFEACLALLKKERRDGLMSYALFAGQMKRLPRSAAQGVFYFRDRSAGGNGSDAVPGPGFGLWPALRGGVVALYAQGNRLDLVLRGAPAGPQGAEAPRIAVPRVHHLPRSTIAAWAFAVDLDGLFDRWMKFSPEAEDASGYVHVLREAADFERLRREVVALLGPRIILVWGRSFETERAGSSLAMLVDSTDADSVKRALDSHVSQLAVTVNREYAQDDDQLVKVVRESHLGTDITVLEVADFARRSKSDSLARRLAMTMRPCYAALDGWLMVAWNLDHLRELIAAHSGVRPVLGEFADVGGLSPSRRGATTLGVLQPATAASVLSEWLDASPREPDSLLSPETWESLMGTRGRRAGGGLGLGLKPRHRAGRVLVLRVYEDGVCHQRVEPGDEIVAINGMALALDDPNADLRRRLHESGGAKELTLRIERDGELMEVTVPVDLPGSQGEGVFADAARALRRLREVFRPLTLATFAVTESDAERYSAQLRLRFSESPVGRPATP